jgi:predicted NAD/FAD-dependent oxidoreductase
LLAAAAPEAAAILSSLAMAPCLALVARYPRKDYPWRGIQAPDHAVISWIGHDTSKRPDLHPDTTILVIHASATFSRDNFGTSEDIVVAQLLASASDIVGVDLTTPAESFLQRWRYALGSRDGAERARLIDSPASLILAGDAVAGGKIEGAWLSGLEAVRLITAPRGLLQSGNAADD